VCVCVGQLLRGKGQPVFTLTEETLTVHVSQSQGYMSVRVLASPVSQAEHYLFIPPFYLSNRFLFLSDDSVIVWNPSETLRSIS